MDFKNKVAAITGAGSGIGRALAVALASEGCALALADVNEQGLEETAGLVAKQVKVTTAVVDVADKDAVFSWAEQVANEHGKINLVINNAGVALSGSAMELPLEDIEWITGINYWGVIYGTRAFLPYLEASGEGHVVNVSSISGLLAQPYLSAYNATKFAVRGYTEGLRQDLALAGSCVSATSVHPGGIKTNVAKAGRKHASVGKLTGMNDADTVKEFEKGFFTTPEKAAAIIIKAVRKNKRRVLVGWDAYIFDLMPRLLPTSYQKLQVFLTKKMFKLK